jgi:NAD(P)-dependent dehydrogenase (short-subunit alcohol dehydrogenase family)
MLLRERLARSGARVIVTSSMAHTSRRANVDLDDLTFERSYRALDAYATTKLENVLFIRELARRWDPLGSRSAAVHPGMVRSRFGARSTLPVRTVMASPLRWIMRSPERGADTIVWLATSTPNIDWTSGGYYADRAPARAHPRADDADLARELWERSAAMVGTMV